ncbi:MAG TPA: hypothetical protein VEL76_09090, partial [Gemmataceae bacterium]|nr:hypothetical protein [Gemmataceae bacterium]
MNPVSLILEKETVMKVLHGAAAGMALAVVLFLGTTTANSAGKPATASPKQVLVVNTGDGTVSQVDLASLKEIGRYKVGPRPYGIAVSQDNKTVAVGIEDEEKVKFFSLPGFTPKSEVKIGKMFNDHIVL